MVHTIKKMLMQLDSVLISEAKQEIFPTQTCSLLLLIVNDIVCFDSIYISTRTSSLSPYWELNI